MNKPEKGLQALRELKTNLNRSKYPNIPEHAVIVPKYTDKTANELTRSIIDFINLSGYQAERINNTGRPIDRRETYTDVLGRTKTIGSIQYIRGTGTNGTADISATIKGRSVKIEVKVGRDKQSQDQKEYQERIERSGGLYVIAKTFQEFYEWYNLNF
jgi:hypothetical protein